MQYLVIEGGQGWTVCDDQQTVSTAQSLTEALATAEIMALAVKAAGGQGSVAIQDKSGKLQSHDLSIF